MIATNPVDAASPVNVESSVKPAVEPAFQLLNRRDNALLQALLESWVDGLLVLTETGEWVRSNAIARNLCQTLSQQQSSPTMVPTAIWEICLSLIDSRETYPNQTIVLESELTLGDKQFRVRVQWFSVDPTAVPHLLVVLEDCQASKRNLAIAEIDRYHLSPRESEVWMLFRLGYSYKEIAKELYISLDTVKKHLKSARVKQLVVGE
ncbi:MAG: LuxR C-terminal-related transcriptional regulator [Oculatellaceae cyanobacterium Prado106]|jgi:DNA-binding CsgD family transcriptional regulator|nr:LuxR C-terminal-related transcriptional regulator [Oculatellaceae cyanobacterium Prado106]